MGPEFVQVSGAPLSCPSTGKEIEMPLTVKDKELVAVGISLAAGCRPCTNYHVREVRKAGAADDEIRQAMADAVLVREGATKIMEGHALERLGVARESTGGDDSTRTSRLRELVSIGAAFAVNCTVSLQRHLRAGEDVGITDEEAEAVVDLAAFIKRMAASHVERIVGKDRIAEEEGSQGSTAAGCHC